MAQLTRDDAIVPAAQHDAERAAAASGVIIRELSAVAEHADAIELLSTIWQRSPENPVVPPELMRALSKAGNYIGGAFSGDELVGVAIAFHADPGRHALYSHIAGISAAHAGHSVGFALKQHQRAWALSRGIGAIEWTFDPLVARNAHFNITKLGACPQEYLSDFYGPMADGVNTDDETDRLLIRWELGDPGVAFRAGGTPPPPFERMPGDLAVAIPADIERIRREDRSEAQRWRFRVREQLTGALEDGGRIVGFDRGEGYIIRPKEETS
ncbi:GNAT family N-acetyltransferase [Microbacterium sp. W4I20]|uniref:GNAT family N-acetyltransferase n=1 Tax=Microbacterium sp. W4I20 TaxID=3042262 RepID=UPI00278A86C0|nr:GNAT family N-acetyltransferase [Microbacterium sp. W4I20]MDQ0728216.1 putative GNAT superfamily acetyltransferase [Microbacterium sp. W4I20]